MYAVMAFSLTNTTAIFQDIIDANFKDMEVCIWYLNNIFIYGSNTNAKHQAIVKKVLQQYVKHGLADNLLKNEFHNYRTIFLEYVINWRQINMDPSKL